MNTVTIAIPGSNSFYKIELSKSLLRFAEFDFTYFWEQCIEAGRNARKTGRISQNIASLAINALIKCHPYVEACINTEFSSVVTDCIIAYICHSEGIGLEELWARCISPKSLYEQDIFRRVSEYKTDRGINQWINIVRMQEYVRSKLNFVYATDDNSMLTHEDYRTRREYFDLAFSVAANETGCPMTMMPSVKKYSPSQLPDSVFMMGRVSKAIYKRLADVLSIAEPAHKKKLNDHNRDQTALDAFSYVKDMPRPGEIDMKFAYETISALPAEVYVPDSFKAAIDLEFTCMQEQGIYLSLCPRCGRFFVRSIDERSPYCSRVNSTGKTCARLIEEELGIAAAKSREESISAVQEEPSQFQTEETSGQLTFEDKAYKPYESTEDLPAAGDAGGNSEADAQAKEDTDPESIPAPQEEPIAFEIPKELEKRCQKVYNLLYKRIGRLMTETEFQEWSHYLSDMKRDVRNGNGDIPQMETFLDYWENAVKKQSRRSRRSVQAEISAEETALENESRSSPDAGADTSLSEMFDQALKAADERESSGISPAGTEASPEERSFKPFNPPKYNTVIEAMMDGKYKSDELLDSGIDEDASEIKVNGRKVTLPEWEKITR